MEGEGREGGMGEGGREGREKKVVRSGCGGGLWVVSSGKAGKGCECGFVCGMGVVWVCLWVGHVYGFCLE